MRADRDLTKLKYNEVLLLFRRLRALRAEATDLGLRWLLAKAELYLLYADSGQNYVVWTRRCTNLRHFARKERI